MGAVYMDPIASYHDSGIFYVFDFNNEGDSRSLQYLRGRNVHFSKSTQRSTSRVPACNVLCILPMLLQRLC